LDFLSSVPCLCVVHLDPCLQTRRLRPNCRSNARLWNNRRSRDNPIVRPRGADACTSLRYQKSKMFVNCKWKTMRYSENAINASIVISRDIRLCNIWSLSSPPGGRLDTGGKPEYLRQTTPPSLAVVRSCSTDPNHIHSGSVPHRSAENVILPRWPIAVRRAILQPQCQT